MSAEDFKKEEMFNIPKLAFFDLDCTLIDPRFLVNGKNEFGMSKETWVNYCKENKDDTYSLCLPITLIYKYAQMLHNFGSEIYTLSVVSSCEEASAKIKFVQENFPEFDKDNILFVLNDDEKNNVIKSIATTKNVPLNKCLLVDDEFSNVLSAISEGIKGLHPITIFNVTIHMRGDDVYST